MRDFMYRGFITEERGGDENTMYWLTGILGLLLILAPFIFSYADQAGALWTSVAVGFIAVVASVWEAMEQRQSNWEYMIAIIVGLFAVVAPFLFGFGQHAVAMWTSIVVGGMMAILAGAKVWTGGTVG